ncbi:MAG: mechanosensitive ion channel [Bacteroidota bacterium]|nr:mechanosensitive ion channel [Bacteroidota bacterium]
MNKLIAFWKEIGTFQILDNDLQFVVIAGAILFVGILFKNVVSHWISRLSYRLVKNNFPEVPVSTFVSMLSKPFELFFVLTIIYAAFSLLHYPDSWHLVGPKKFGLKMIVNRTYGVIIFFSIGWIVFRLVDFVAFVLKDRAIENESKVQEQLVPFIRQLSKLLVGIIFFFLILGVVFQVNVGAVITGLGIGGVAVALAGKETLENLLASFSIFADKPFIAGDLIKVGDFTGNVESVGFRTTRIRTLDKSLVTIPNKQLIDQPLENLSARKYHRANFKVGLPVNVSEKTIKTIIGNIENEISSNPLTDSSLKPMVYFDGFGTYTLDITVIFYAKATEFEDFWKIKENINFRIMKVLEAENLGVEFPTQVVHVKSQEKLA